MKASEVIIVPLDNIEQLIEPCPPSPFRRRRLREEAEEFLVERVTALPRKASARLAILLPRDQSCEEESAAQAISSAFRFPAHRSRKTASSHSAFRMENPRNRCSVPHRGDVHRPIDETLFAGGKLRVGAYGRTHHLRVGRTLASLRVIVVRSGIHLSAMRGYFANLRKLISDSPTENKREAAAAEQSDA